MSRDEQIAAMRKLYVVICSKFYQKRFQLLLTALLIKDPDYYQKRRECICALTKIVENTLILEETDRTLHYLVCLEKTIRSLEKRMQADRKRYWKHLCN